MAPGGHAKSCVPCIETTGYNIAGLLDLKDKIGQIVEGYPVIGSDDDIIKFVNEGALFLVTLGFTDNPALRIEKFNYLMSVDAKIATVVSDDAFVVRSAFIDAGSIVMNRSFVNTGAVVAKNCIVNTGAIIEHDVKIADNTHISTSVVINGGSVVGSECLIGSGSVVSNNINICDNVIVGAGSVVVKDIIEPGTYYGIPANRMK